MHELVPHAHVGEEVAEPEGAPRGALGDVLLGGGLGLGVEVLPLQDVLLVGVVEEEVGVGDGGHCDGEIVVVEQSRGPVAVHIVELRPRVAGNEEEGAGRPLEGVGLAAAFAPHRGRALAARDVDHLVDGLLEGPDGAARGYLLHASLDDAGHAFELDECGVALAQAPRGDLDGPQVFDEVAPVDGNALCVHPAVVGEFFGHDGVSCSGRDEPRG